MQEKVNFYSGPGYRLTGILYVPDKLEGGERRPGLVLCQGYASTKEINLPYAAERLVGAGYVVLNFDYRGFGESEGPRYRLIPMEQVEDVRNAMTYLESRSEVDGRRIGLWGASLGGANCIYAAAMDPRAKCVVSLVGLGNGERQMHYLRREWEWQEFKRKLVADRKTRVLTGQSQHVHPYDILVTAPEGWKFWEESIKAYPERANTKIPLETAEAMIEFKPEEVVHRIAPRPVLFFSAEEDALTPLVEQQTMFNNAGEPRKLVVFSGIDHHGVYKQPTYQKVLDMSLEWFDKYLKGDWRPADEPYVNNQS
jgi:hypothetical protein